jgi:bifunctional non-homologous end joining protein LigD
MSLAQYKKKRHFDQTPEPTAKEKSSKGSLRFVIQKHDASHLHYDFRLEMDGVLKSWAVPKGPSLNPADKRLAMAVEDHPFDYRDFEGIIPAGNYGGGTVIVWDEGTYEPLEKGLSRKEQEKLLLKELHAGNLKFTLHGEKLKGEYALFLMKSRGERSWILMKKKDAYATAKDVLQQDRSVKSKKTIAEVAAENGTIPNHPEEGKTSRKSKRPIQLLSDSATRKAGKAKPSARTKQTDRKASKAKSNFDIKEQLGAQLKLARKRPMFEEVSPMLATLFNEPFDNKDWLFEIKWDGYRSLAYCKHDEVELLSRNEKPFSEKYSPVTEALQQLSLNAVLDGEIVAVNDKGMADFQKLQNWQNTPVKLQYYVFDILWLEGFDITSLPLVERKRILKSLLPEEDEVIRYSDHVIGKGKEFFEVAIAQGLEGIMAKKSSSPYVVDDRSADWLKVKVSLRQEVVIAGYTQPRKTRKFFGSLLLGIYSNKELQYVGHTGSGFNAKSLEAIYKKLQPLTTDKCPFNIIPKTNMPPTWVKPELVCEIKFTEWTKDRVARHPIFMGLRDDKKAKDVVFEKATTMASIAKTKKASLAKKTTSNKAAAAKKTTAKKTAGKKVSFKESATATKLSATKPKRDKETGDKKDKASATKQKSSKVTDIKSVDVAAGADQTIELNGVELQLTNLSKLYWKKEGFTKGDMINYYLRVAPYIMPYMLDRPQSLNRHPGGIDGPNFYQKNMKGKLPPWATAHEDYSESNNKTIDYLVCSNEATLIYMANLGCIELHPWHARVQTWQYPDWCLIDLDPDDGNTFEQVIETALVVKQVLDAIGAESYPKTSGSSGIHIYIPLGAKYTYDQSRQFAELVVNIVHQQLPDTTSLERSPSKRKGLIYLDYLQNRETQTAAAPYSLRPKPGVPVSTPLDWSEVKKGLTPTTYNAKNIFNRLEKVGDLFQPVLGKGIDLQKLLTKLAAQTS